MSSWLNKCGVVKVATKQGKPEKPKNVDKNNRIKEICLSCTKAKCNGNCKKLREKMKNETV